MTKKSKKVNSKKTKVQTVPKPPKPLTGPQVKPLPFRREVDPQELKSIEDDVRDIINWVNVFETEYDLPKEVVDKLLERLHNVARRVGWLHCH